MKDDLLLQRVIRDYRPGAWVGSVRRAFGPVAHLPEDGDGAAEGVIDSHPPHYLLALWQPLPPDRPFLPRWPMKVSLAAPDARAAIHEMLAEVPPNETLWLTDQPLDWVLMAEIVMLCEEGLQPYQFRGLGEFIEAERQATRAAVSVHYGGSDEVFEQFSRTLPPEL
jgi:hypothetical protein